MVMLGNALGEPSKSTKKVIDWFEQHRVKVVNVSLHREEGKMRVDFVLVVGFMTTPALQKMEVTLQDASPYELLGVESL